MAPRSSPPQDSSTLHAAVAWPAAATRRPRVTHDQAERLVRELLEMSREPTWALPQASCDAIDHLAGKVLDERVCDARTGAQILELAQHLSRERNAFLDYMAFRASLEAAGTPPAMITREAWLEAQRDAHAARQGGIVLRGVRALLRRTVSVVAVGRRLRSPCPVLTTHRLLPSR